MKRKAIKTLIFEIIIVFILSSTGCFKMVDSYTKFHIEGFVEFYDIVSLEEREKYIDSGKLDFAEKEDVFFLPFIKEVSETECVILMSLYSEDTDNKVTLDKISLVTADGEVIASYEEYGELEVLSELSDSMSIIGTFPKSEDWFYSENNLTLNIEATINNGDESSESEISYNMSLMGYRGPAWSW